MKLPRLKVRTLLIVVAALAVLLEVIGLGQRSRRYATEASKAAELERSSLQIAHDAEIYLVESLKEADQIVAKDPARAAWLRLNAERLTRSIPYLRGEAVKAAEAKASFERAMTHPWEGPPKEDDRLYATPPPGPP